MSTTCFRLPQILRQLGRIDVLVLNAGKREDPGDTLRLQPASSQSIAPKRLAVRSFCFVIFCCRV